MNFHLVRSPAPASPLALVNRAPGPRAGMPSRLASTGAEAFRREIPRQMLDFFKTWSAPPECKQAGSSGWKIQRLHRSQGTVGKLTGIGRSEARAEVRILGIARHRNPLRIPSECSGAVRGDFRRRVPVPPAPAPSRPSPRGGLREQQAGQDFYFSDAPRGSGARRDKKWVLGLNQNAKIPQPRQTIQPSNAAHLTIIFTDR